MEACDMRDLQHLPDPSPQDRQERIKLAYQLALALATMHKHDFCHMDVKPENAFLKTEQGEPSVRLGDFELAEKTGTIVKALLGTPGFLAPEALSADTWIADPSGDMWGLGLTLLELTHGKSANQFIQQGQNLDFSSHANQALRGAWEQIHSEIIKNLDLADPVDQLIADLLNFNNPSARPSAQQAADRLLQIIIEG